MKKVSRHVLILIIVLVFSMLVFAFADLQKFPFVKSVDISNPNDDLIYSIFAKHEATVPIITYHYVEVVTDKRDFIRKSLSILPSELEFQIKTLREQGYEPVFARDIPAIVAGNLRPTKKPVALTFDDGYGDFYTDVFPHVKKYNVKVTAYIIPGFLDKLNYMTSAQLQEVVNSGLVEIGAHTMHHPNLQSIPLDVAKDEIAQSKKDLENSYHIKVVSFAYPYGNFNENIVRLVRDAGYTNAVTEVYGTTQYSDNLLELNRVRVGYFNLLFLGETNSHPIVQPLRAPISGEH